MTEKEEEKPTLLLHLIPLDPTFRDLTEDNNITLFFNKTHYSKIFQTLTNPVLVISYNHIGGCTFYVYLKM